MARLHPQELRASPLTETPFSSHGSEAATVCHDIRSVVARQIIREWAGEWRGGKCHRPYDDSPHHGRRIAPILVWEN